MLDDIEVSVLCITYNQDKYIRKCLEGFISQKTTFKFEVIIHDDASKDNTAVIIKEFEDKYPCIIKPIYQTENQYSKKINILEDILLQKARGKYIAICEGDDFWTDEYKLEKQYEALEKNHNCSICTCLVKCCNEDGESNSKIIPSNDFNFIKTGVYLQRTIAEKLLSGKYIFHTSSYFARRSMFLNRSNELVQYLKRDEGILRQALISGDFYYINDAMSMRRLDSIGNWNSQRKAGGVDFSRKFNIEQLEMDMYLDFYIDGKYEDIVITTNFRRILFEAKFSISSARKYIKQYLREKGFFRFYKNIQGIKNRIKFLIIWFLPFLYKFFMKKGEDYYE